MADSRFPYIAVHYKILPANGERFRIERYEHNDLTHWYESDSSGEFRTETQSFVAITYPTDEREWALCTLHDRGDIREASEMPNAWMEFEHGTLSSNPEWVAEYFQCGECPDDADEDIERGKSPESQPAKSREGDRTMPSQFKLLIGVVGTVFLISFLPALLISKYPDEFTAIAAYVTTVVLSGITALITLAISLVRETSLRDEIERQQRGRWLPQAESACNSLLTIHADVRMIVARIDTACSRIGKSLPELEPNANREVQNILAGHCEECIGPLRSITNHLDGAVKEWERFMNANCSESECDDITRRLNERYGQLDREVVSAKARLEALGSCSGTGSDAANSNGVEDESSYANPRE